MNEADIRASILTLAPRTHIGEIAFEFAGPQLYKATGFPHLAGKSLCDVCSRLKMSVTLIPRTIDGIKRDILLEFKPENSDETSEYCIDKPATVFG